MEITRNIMLIDKYRQAMVEVDALLEYASEQEKNNIPESFLRFIKNNKSKDYAFEIDINRSLEEQKIMRETKVLLSLIYRGYFCDEETKKQLQQEDAKQLKKIEEEKLEKYNPDNIFKKQIKNEETVMTNELAMIEYKQSFFSKFINKIKKIFKIK